MPEAKKTTLNCFKEYDVRGKLGYEFNESIAYRIGRSVSEHLKVVTVVIGYDARATSKVLRTQFLNQCKILELIVIYWSRWNRRSLLGCS